MKKVFLALKRHKYKHPMSTINYMQKLFDGLKAYKQEDDSINENYIDFVLN